MRNALDPRVVVDSSSASVMGCVGARTKELQQQQLPTQRTGLITRPPQHCASSWGCGAARSCARRSGSNDSPKSKMVFESVRFSVGHDSCVRVCRGVFRLKKVLPPGQASAHSTLSAKLEP